MDHGSGSRRRHTASQASAVALLALLLSTPAAGADVFRYGRFEQSFTSSKDVPNPLAEEVKVEFTSPGGQRQEVLAFWDGGRRWKVRFSPEQAGTWKYEGFGQSGQFRVSEYKGRNPLYRRGAPRLSKNRRYFVQADGTPWFWLADTAWNGALLSTREEWEKYLADRSAKKFTAIQFVTTQWRAGRQDERGQVAFTGTDRIEINLAFFERMDQKIQAINEHGLVAAPVLLWALTSKDRESPGEGLPDDQAILLARYMVSRYDAHGVVWLLGGDGDYRGARAERWKTVGRAVFADTRPHRLVTMHPRGMQSPWPEYRDEPWVGFFMYQSGHGNDPRKWRWNATQGGAADWKLAPARPVVDGEINYEGHLDYQTQKPIAEAQVRRAAYYSLLGAPPAGVTYGAHGIWPWIRTPSVPLDHPRTGVAQPWFECLDYPGARQMKALREIFDSVAWWKLRPDRALLAEDSDDPEFRNHIMAALSETGDFALLYLPANDAVKLNPGKFRKAVWLDPRTGQRQPAAVQPEMKTPGSGDWVLLLR